MAAFFLSACAQDLGGITKVRYNAQTGDVEYDSGKEAAGIDLRYIRDPEGNLEIEVTAGDVKAFEGQEIQAERIKAQTQAITEGVVDALPGIVKGVLCATGQGAAC